jgi:hypothetical protein
MLEEFLQLRRRRLAAETYRDRGIADAMAHHPLADAAPIRYLIACRRCC